MKEHNLGSKILLLVSAFLWGTGFLATEAALNAGWAIFPILFVRQFIAGMVMVLLAGKFHLSWHKNRKLIIHCAFAGLIMWLGFVLQTYGQRMTTVGKTSIYTALYTLMTPFLAYLVNKTKLSLKLFIACLIAFISVVVVSYDGGMWVFGWGELLLLGCALFFAWHLVLVENIGSYKMVFATSGVQLLVMSFCSLVMMLFLHEPLQGQGLPYVLYLAAFCSGGAFLFQVYAQRNVDSATTGLLLSFESLFGVIGAIILFNESLSWQIISGCLLMLLAVYVLERKSKPKP